MDRRKYFPHSPLKIIGFFIAAILFSITSFALIYLAKGYVFQLDGLVLTFKKTGMIIFSSKPSDANVWINDKKVKKKSGSPLFPSKITGLLSGDYVLRLEKDKYFPWEKKLKIEEGFVSWADYIILFSNSKKRDFIAEEGKILNAVQAPDLRRVVYVYENSLGKKEIWILDSLNLTKAKTYPPENPTEKDTLQYDVKEIIWSEDASKILVKRKVGDKDDFLVLGAKEPLVPINLTDTFKMDFSDLSWSPTDPNELFWLKENSLYKINLPNKTISASLADKVAKLSITENRSLYLVRDLGGEKSLWTIDTDGKNLSEIIKSLPASKNYTIRYSKKTGNILIAVDGDVRTLYSTKTVAGKLELTEISRDATNAFWSPDGKKVLYYNEKSVTIFDTEKEKEYQAIKDGKIKQALWYLDDYHLAVNDGGEFTVLEFDGANSHSFGKSSIDNIFFSPEYKYLLYLGEHEGKKDNIFIYSIRP